MYPQTIEEWRKLIANVASEIERHNGYKAEIHRQDMSDCVDFSSNSIECLQIEVSKNGRTRQFSVEHDCQIGKWQNLRLSLRSPERAISLLLYKMSYHVNTNTIPAVHFVVSTPHPTVPAGRLFNSPNIINAIAFCLDQIEEIQTLASREEVPPWSLLEDWELKS